jgi:hypothetical protein
MRLSLALAVKLIYITTKKNEERNSKICRKLEVLMVIYRDKRRYI